MSKSEHLAVAQTPILNSGVLPIRTSRDPAVGTVVGAIGFGIVIVGAHLAGGSSNTEITFLLVYAALFFAILIHELGHLTAGWYLEDSDFFVLLRAGGRHNDNHHLHDCLKYLVLSFPAQAPLEVRLAAMVQMAP